MESSDGVRSSDEIQTVRLRRSSRGSLIRSNTIRVGGRRRGEEGAAVWSRERRAGQLSVRPHPLGSLVPTRRAVKAQESSARLWRPC